MNHLTLLPLLLCPHVCVMARKGGEQRARMHQDDGREAFRCDSHGLPDARYPPTYLPLSLNDQISRVMFVHSVMDGFQATQRLRELESDHGVLPNDCSCHRLPIIALTASATTVRAREDKLSLPKTSDS